MNPHWFICSIYWIGFFWVVSPGLLAEGQGNGTRMDIHVVVEGELLFEALQLGDWLSARAPHDQVDFRVRDVPHITLYLTEFRNESVQSVVQAVRSVLPRLPYECKSTTAGFQAPPPHLATGYGLWILDISDCLQDMSNQIVLATHQFMVPNQPIPPWVMQLPEPERSEKIAMIREYGSPNVFSQFNPHVTLIYDELDNVTQLFDQMPVPSASFSFTVVDIGIGAVESDGMVTRAGGWGQYRIPPHN